MKFRAIIFGFYLIVFPFYLYPSGGPQIADVIGIILILFSLKSIFANIKKYKFFKYLLVFFCYSFLLNLIWVLILQDFILLKSSITYLYCLLLSISSFFCFENKKYSKLILKFLLISALLQLILIPFSAREWGFRTILFFNNPNQLALWSINFLLIINVLLSNLNLKNRTKNILYLVPTFFAILSVSKAVIASFVLFWAYIFLKEGFTLKNVLFSTLLVLLFVNNQDKINDLQFISDAVSRIETDNLDDDSLEGRGFDRIWNHPEYLIFGAGEGLNNRFTANYKGEIHSTFFNILFSYGLLGLLLISIAFFGILKSSHKKDKFILFLCLFIFSLGHMTLRIPLFWIAITSLYFFKFINLKNHTCAE